MPSSAKITAEKAQKTDNAGYASVQLGSGQRIRIPLSITGVDASGASVKNDGTSLPTKVTVGGNDVTVVWFGRRTVSYNNSNNYAVSYVTYSDIKGAAVTLEGQPGRTVIYELYPMIGAVIDSSGAVVDMKTAKSSELFDWTDEKYSAHQSMADKVISIPNCQVMGSMVTITI